MAIGPISSKCENVARLARLAGLCGSVLLSAGMLIAQTPDASAPDAPHATPKQATPQTAHSTHRHKKQEPVTPAPAPAAEERPAEPPPPDWPALAQANPPDVHFSGSNLTVVAQNASLQQILREITTATGVRVEGFSNDQRIFGNYGPAPAREVINQLLDGTGYNVLMIGDRGEGTPRQLVLTFQGGGAAVPGQQTNAEPNQNGDEDGVVEEQPEVQEQPEPPVVNRPFRNQPPGRTPQQMLQEMQMRQQQMQQQQQVVPAPN